MSEKKFILGLSLEAQQAVKLWGSNIRQARKARGWSIEEAAQRALMNKNTYRQVESGALTVSIGAYIAVMDVMDVLYGVEDLVAPHKDELGRRLRS